MKITELIDFTEIVSDDTISAASKLCLNLPIEKVSSSEVITKQKGWGLPPQPTEEIIKIETLRKKLKGKDPVNTFLGIDQILSLLPRKVLQELSKANSKESIEVLRTWAKKLKPAIGDLNKLTVENLKAEDVVKQRILLIIPSKRQFNIVRGKWREWAWKEKTYMGNNTPSEEGWLESTANLCNALKENGVNATVVADRDISQKVKEVVSGSKVMEIDMPENLAKIGYPRDQSVTWFYRPIIGNMALDIRRGEEEVLNEIYEALGCIPSARVRWANFGKCLVRAKMEGGNFFLLKSNGEALLLTGIGVRGSNHATFKILANLMPENVRLVGIPLAGYLRNWEAGAVHLDVVFAYLGEIEGHKWALVDPSRMGFYSALEYDRKTDSFKLIEFGQIIKELEITLEEPPRKGASTITMTNALNLGKGRFIVDKINCDVNKYMQKELGAQIIEVDIPHIEAGGGGPRCATRELYF
jgi:arginine deiminase